MEDQKNISSTFCNHFRGIFTKNDNLIEKQLHDRILPLNRPTFGVNQKEELNKPFSLEEIKKVAFQICLLKTSRIDGKPGIFYQKFLHIVGSLTTASSLSFLNLGHLFEELNKKLSY